MIREEIRQLKTGPKELRKFGVTVGAVFLLLGGWFWFRHKAHYLWFLWPGVALVTFGVIAPKALKYVYIGWMALAFVLGTIVSTLLLVLFFYLIVTPIGLAARCLGKDFLSRRWERNTTTYWLFKDRSRPVQSADYERQF